MVSPVSTKSKRTGTAAETAVVRYLQQWWPAAERRALSGSKDKGDVAGIPGVVIEVKAAQRQELTAWRRETLAEMENADADLCMLVVKRSRKPVAEWDAYMPAYQTFLGGHNAYRGRDQWVRMDLVLAVAAIAACEQER